MLRPKKISSADAFLLLLLLHCGSRRAAWNNGFVFELVLGINKMFYLQHLQVCL